MTATTETTRCSQAPVSGAVTDRGGPGRLDAVHQLAASGRTPEAAHRVRLLLDDGGEGDPEASDLRLLLSRLWLLDGQAVEAAEEAARVVATPGASSDVRADAGMTRLLAVAAQGDFGQMRADAEAFLAGDGMREADTGLVEAFTGLALLAWHDGRVADAVGLLHAGIRREADGGQPSTRLFMRLGLAVILISLGDFDDADAALAWADAELVRTGEQLWQGAVDSLRARTLLARGRTVDALSAVGATFAGPPVPQLFGPLAHRVGAAAALQLGSVSEAADHVAQFRAASPAGRIIWGAASFRYVEAQVAEAQCGSERAAEILAPIYDDVPRHKRLLAEEPAAAGWLTRLAMAVDDRPGAARIVTCIEQMADDNRDRPSIVASADQARGLYAADPARLERAAAHHTQAWASAAATEDLAVVLADRGETHASREQLRVAARAYAAAGSPRSEAGARAVMRRVERVATNRPVSGWASLTETESRVAHVVADGLSNPEVGRRMFLSRHTVDFHLRQIYRKLAIHSRVELTRFVLENDAQ